MQSVYINKTVSEIVRADYRTADVFKRHGINYCCGGQVVLQDACSLKQIPLELLLKDLEQAARNIQLPNTLQFESWKISFLIDYLINVHHAYLEHTLPVLQGSLISFANSHKKQHPELIEIMEVFEGLSSILLTHNRYEEEVIFPYIKQLENTFRHKESYGSLFVRTLRKPLEAIEKEHQEIERLMDELRRLTNRYSFKDNACTNHRVIFNKLREFDNDLVQHKHLENNILFPKAIRMEKDLLVGV